MDEGDLKLIDNGLSSTIVAAPLAGDQTYCITSTVGSKTWSVKGPGAQSWYDQAACAGTAVTP
jgi:hypothetical protein